MENLRPQKCELSRFQHVVPGSGYRSKARCVSGAVHALLCASFCVGCVATAHTQVAPSSQGGVGAVSVYALASADNTQYKTYPHSLGGTAGVSVMHNRLFGLTAEASAIRLRSPIHDYIGIIGPRFAVPLGRFRFFGEGLGGIGHAGYPQFPKLPTHGITHSYGYALAVAAGIDFRISHRIYWRVQANYTHIAAGPGVNTETGSTGIVFRLF